MPSVSLPLVAAGVGAAGSIGGALISSSASDKASQEQAQAAQNALNVQQAENTQALNTEVAGENAGLATLAPYTQIGTGAANQLANLYGIGYGPSGSASSTTSPTGVVTPGNINAAASSPGGAGVEAAAMQNFTNTPDYNFAFTQGLQALDRSAAAGTTPGLSAGGGGAVKGAEQFGQGLASQQFGNYYNRLLSLAQIGQGAASGTASTALNAGNTQGTNLLNSGNSQANSLQAIGQAQASGTVGSANALSAGLNGVGNSLTSSLLLSKLGVGGNGASLASAYNNSTGNYAGLTDAGQDALQDSGLSLPGF